MHETLEAQRAAVGGVGARVLDAPPSTTGYINEEPASKGDLSARVGLPLETAQGTTTFDPNAADTPTAALSTPGYDTAADVTVNKPSRFNGLLGTKRGKAAVGAMGAAVLFAASAVKPNTAEASYGLFGPKITTVTDANSYLDFSLGEDCSPVRDSIGEAVGVQTDAGQSKWITPGNVQVIAKNKAHNSTWRTSTGAAGCESVTIPNVHGTSTAFTYAMKDIPNTAEARRVTREIKSGPYKGWHQLLTIKGRGECGLQAISRKLPPRHKPKVTPTYGVNVSNHIAVLIAAAAAQSRAEQSVTVKCGDSVFTSHQKADAEADALGLIVTGIRGKKDVVIKDTDLSGENSWAAVQIAFQRKAAAIIAAARASADTSAEQDITADCGPGAQPSVTPTATATASPSPSPTPTPSPSPTATPRPITVVVEQKTPGFEGVNEGDPYTVCARVTEGDPKSWSFKLRYDSLANPPDADLDNDGLADIDGYNNPLEAKSRCVDLRAPNAVYNDDEVIVSVVSVDGSKASDTTGKYPIRQPAQPSPKPVAPSYFSFNFKNKALGGLKV
jgi:hypothetical protein